MSVQEIKDGDGEMESTAQVAAKPAPKARTKQNQGYWSKYGSFYIMMAPALIVLLINNYLPMLGTAIAFKQIVYTSQSFIQSFLDSEWVGWANFDYLFSTTDAYIITRNTLLYNAVFIFLNIVIGIVFALMFNAMRNGRLAKFHQTTMFLPYFLSMVIISYLVYAFLNADMGIINRIVLPAFGLDPIDWYTESKWWPYILPLVNTWKGIGYYAVIFLAAIIGIDNEYYEAATIDGASKWRQVWSITIPLIRPVIIILTLLQVGRIFYSDFGLFFQVTRNSGILYDTTLVIDTYVYNSFIFSGDIGMSSSAGLYQAVVGFLLVFLTNLVIRKVSKDDALF